MRARHSKACVLLDTSLRVWALWVCVRRRYLDSALGAERFASKPDEDRLAELDLLRKYLGEAAEAVDK